MRISHHLFRRDSTALFRAANRLNGCNVENRSVSGMVDVTLTSLNPLGFPTKLLFNCVIDLFISVTRWVD